MNLDLSNPDILRDCRQAVLSLVSEDWLHRKLATLERERTRKGGIERLLLMKPTHPIVEWESKFGKWIEAAEAGHRIGGGGVYAFGRAGWIVEHARRLPGGTEFVGNLHHAVVEQRTTSKAIRQFWDLLFEGEAALHCAAGGGVVRLGPPGGNPDFSLLIQDSEDAERSWAIPVECWRPARSVEYTAQFEDVWTQLQRGLMKLIRTKKVALKVAIRTQTDVELKHVQPLLQEVERLIPQAADAKGSWVASTIEDGSFQVSIGDICSLAKDKIITHFGLEDLDMAAEPPLTLAVRGVQTDHGILGDGFALALRPTTDPGWLTDHVRSKLADKATQLEKSCGEESAPVGLLAVELPPVNRKNLLDIDVAVRETISGQAHVAAVILYLTESLSVATPIGDDRSEVAEGEQMVPYVVVNDAATAVPGFSDSREEYFDPEILHGLVVDAETGSMERTGYGLEGGPELHKISELKSWPAGIESRFPDGFDPAEGSFGMKIRDVDSFFVSTGDQLLLEITSGASTFRLVRDRHLNLRWLRVGERGRIRDHVVMDLRPFRNATTLIICPVWDKKHWRVIVGSEVEGEHLEARRRRST